MEVARSLRGLPEPEPSELGSELAALPAASSPPKALERLAEQLLLSRTKVVAIDDDPTGSQPVAGVPLLLATEDAEDLRWALGSESDLVFVLTNSRAMSEQDAVALNRRLGTLLQATANELRIELRIASRSDSTLRGHFPAEVEALDLGLREGGAAPMDAILLCPAFVEAGRVTVGDFHWLTDGESGAPVASTEFAHDRAFGYTTSHLPAWVAARYGEERPGEGISTISLEEVRRGGVERVADLLMATCGGEVVILNAAERADLEVLTLGISAAERLGKRFIYRVGPSFPPVRAGREPASPIGMLPPRPGNGLVAVGSHTAVTSRQLERAIAEHDLSLVELSTDALLDPARSRAAIEEAVADTVEALARGSVALATSRAEVYAGEGGPSSVELKARISAGLVDAVRGVLEQSSPAYLLAKGGITANDLATRALGARRATVLGPLLPGQISVWELEDAAFAPGVPFVVFPGNVGGAETLSECIGLLEGGV